MLTNYITSISGDSVKIQTNYEGEEAKPDLFIENPDLRNLYPSDEELRELKLEYSVLASKNNTRYLIILNEDKTHRAEKFK